MTTDIIEVNDFIVLIEQSNADKAFEQRCEIDGDALGFAFYGSGNVELEIKFENETKIVKNTSGIAISFFGNSKVEFIHKIAPDKPLQSVSFFIKSKNIAALPEYERLIFQQYLLQLILPTQNFVEGPGFYMTPDMQQAVHKIFSSSYKGSTRLMFLKSQVTELLAHFFAFVAQENFKSPSVAENEKLYQAKEIITSNMASPPSMDELSKMIGLNNNKLKKNFKELFGIPVFKYLQEERLNKAYELLSQSDKSVQETAWVVGYESLSSFSNAFQKKFGVRPNDIRHQFFSNKL